MKDFDQFKIMVQTKILKPVIHVAYLRPGGDDRRSDRHRPTKELCNIAYICNLKKLF